MKLSIIIPAYNEAKRIESCLSQLNAALRANTSSNLGSEIIVVDNNSTDATAQLARNAGAQVVFEPINQIARARNAGADADFGWRLKRWSRAQGWRMRILHAHPPVTSLRKVELYGWKELLVLIARWILFPRRTTRDKARLHVFYDGRR